MSHAGNEPTPSLQLLNNAIDDSTISRLRTVLRDICNESPEAFKLACDKLLIQGKVPNQAPGRTAQRPINLDDDEDDDDEDEDEDEDEDSEDDVEEEPPLDPQPGRKRGRAYAGPRYEICEQCNEEYDVLLEEECVWHEGELEVDYESSVWYDWDEGPHGPMDTEENRKAYPEGFVWSCCEESGNEDGCMTTFHEPTSTKKIRW